MAVPSPPSNPQSPTTTTNPPPPTASSTDPDLSAPYARFKHTTALTLLLLTPILIAIPPRKLDLYTFSLTGAFIASASQLNKERNGGKSLISSLGYKFREEPQSSSDATAAVAAEQQGKRLLEIGGDDGKGEGSGSLLQGKVKEDQDWKKKRLEEEQEKLNEGEGYGGMIMDQIWDVWNQEGRKKAQELVVKEGVLADDKSTVVDGKKTGKDM